MLENQDKVCLFKWLNFIHMQPKKGGICPYNLCSCPISEGFESSRMIIFHPPMQLLVLRH